MLYYLDLIGTFAFAIAGAFHARTRDLNIFATILLGTVTGVGGGTVRDLLIGRTPLFYLIDPNYLVICTFAGTCTYFMPNFFRKNYSFFRFFDSIGLSAFAIIGVSIYHSYLFPLETTPTLISAIDCIFAGILTGFGGSVIRNAMMGTTAFAFNLRSNYIFSAFCGATVFYFISFYNLQIAILTSFLVTMVNREIISEYGTYTKLIKHFFI
jgi:uncharacterized membrane protein YeiH